MLLRNKSLPESDTLAGRLSSLENYALSDERYYKSLEANCRFYHHSFKVTFIEDARRWVIFVLLIYVR